MEKISERQYDGKRPDFQKVHHIMTIAQNNEKTNQVISMIEIIGLIKFYYYYL